LGRAAAACALALFNAFSPLVMAIGSTWALTGICLASGGVNVVMDLALIPRYGIRGAALATVIAYGTSAVMALAFVRARLKWPVFRLALLALPVVIVSVGFALFDDVMFYLIAVPAAAAAAYWLARLFELFRREDAAVVADLRGSRRIAPDVSLVATRRPSRREML
jgi:O-antigen/teichoic acid export membrane protein